jgi:hypothetical protein
MVKKYTNQSDLFSDWMSATSLIFDHLDTIKTEGSNWFFREGWVTNTYASDYVVTAIFETFGLSDSDHKQISISVTTSGSVKSKVMLKQLTKEQFV